MTTLSPCEHLRLSAKLGLAVEHLTEARKLLAGHADERIEHLTRKITCELHVLRILLHEEMGGRYPILRPVEIYRQHEVVQ